MKCEKCGQKFSLAVGGMGMSDKPGAYFRCGLVFLVGSLVLLVLHIYLWFGLCLLFAAMMIGWSFEARYEVISSDCPNCHHTNPIKPWSL